MKVKILLGLLTVLLLATTSATTFAGHQFAKQYQQTGSLIYGRVVDSEDKPLENIFVELIEISHLAPKVKTTKNEPDIEYVKVNECITDKDGRFSFLPTSGEYILAVNYAWSINEDKPFPTTFYPNTSQKNQATVFDMNSEIYVDELQFSLPERLQTTIIQGNVVWSDGTPAKNIEVSLRDVKNEHNASLVKTDKTGQFILRGFIGQNYYVSATNFYTAKDAPASYAKTSTFMLDKDLFNFQLVLERK